MYKFDLDLKHKIDLFLKVSSFKIKNFINFKYFYLIKLCIPLPNISIYFVYFLTNLKKISLILEQNYCIQEIFINFFYLLKHFEMFTE